MQQYSAKKGLFVEKTITTLNMPVAAPVEQTRDDLFEHRRWEPLKRDKIIYYVTTGLLSLLMVFSAGMYFFNYAEVAKTFAKLGYPTYIVIPLAIAKLLGLVAIWTRYSQTLREWAYAGFFFDFVLAASAHTVIQDNQAAPAIVAIVLLLASYLSGKRLETESSQEA